MCIRDSTGTATGIGEVKVTMTFSETAITDVVIDASNETESIGGVAAPTPVSYTHLDVYKRQEQHRTSTNPILLNLHKEKAE